MGAGDESALSALYDRWAGRIHTIAFWILADADEAEDVVEETFWQAWRTAARFDPARAAPSTWLMMMARSRAVDRLRQRRRTDGRLSAAAATEGLLEHATPSSLEPPARHAEQTEHAERIVAALACLPAEQRSAIEMAFFEGMTHAEISARADVPLGTAKTRLRLAMQKLRQQLAVLREDPTP